VGVLANGLRRHRTGPIASAYARCLALAATAEFRQTVLTSLKRTLHGLSPRRILPYVGLVLFGAALYVIYTELRGFRYTDVVAYFRSMPAWTVGAALGLTGVNYALLTVYDWLGVRYVGARLPYRKSALAAGIGYSFSIALGHAYLTGGAARYRLYSAWGLSGTDIAKIIVFCGMSFWIGYAALGGAVFTLAPPTIPEELRLPMSLRPLGVILLIILAVYLVVSARRRASIRLAEWHFEIPALRLTVAQGSVAIVDMLLSATILYVLLPASPETSFFQLVAVFLLATIAGYLSQVPGGLGVFDGVVLLLVTPPLDPASVLGALLAFRGIFYLLPLLIGATTFGVYEAVRYGDRIQVASRRITRAIPRIVPTVLALLVFLTGTLLLVAGALPADADRLTWLADFLPLGIFELVHALSAVVGGALLFLAIALNRRMEAAFTGSQIALGLGFVLSLFRGGWEEGFAIAFVMLGVAPCRAFFYRRSSLLSQPLPTGFVAALVAVLISTWWVGLLVYGDAALAPTVVFQGAWDADAARFARFMIAAAVTVVVLILGHALYPAPPGGELLDDANTPRVRELAFHAADPLPSLSLQGDKYLLFAPERDAMLPYGVRGRSWVALGDPVGSPPAVDDLIWKFHLASVRAGGRIVFYQVGSKYRQTYLEVGLGLFRLGDVGLVPADVSRMPLQLREMADRMEAQNCAMSIVPPEGVTVHLSRLRDLSDGWREERGSGEKAFAIGNFEENYIQQFPVVMIRHEGRVVAFGNLVTTQAAVAVDVLRLAPTAPPGTLDFLFVRLTAWAERNGYRHVNLGLTPSAGIDDRLIGPLWTRSGSLLYPHGEYFYNYRALRAFKERFAPQWSPRFIAAPGGIELPGVLRDVEGLISGGVRGAIGP
jgi:phosphatidylglycerol lysyltransferase